MLLVLDQTISALKSHETAWLENTFMPMQRIAPVSSGPTGDKTLWIVSVAPVGLPGSKTELPEKTSTATFSPLRMDRPTSIASSLG